MAHYEVLLHRVVSSLPTVIHGALVLKLYPLVEANGIADYLENQSTPNGL
jgi:hypothetical protein